MELYFLFRFTEGGDREYYTNHGIFGRAAWTLNKTPGTAGCATLYEKNDARTMATKLGVHIERYNNN